ncbi:MAG TPA: RluA family pseudouridine synthase [Acidimicrobiia bacterium]|nr:RluA family pseudouridine synthase [Acidimicrobiia bacterium]
MTLDAAEPLDAFPVPDALAGERVDRAVALVTGWSRADVQSLIELGAVLVDGRAVAKSRRLEVGELVELLAAPEPVGPPGPEALEIAVVHDDADIVVVDKPAGLVVHPGAGHESGTLVNGLLARYPELAAVGDPLRPGLVHRLDRDTSGLLVVARSARAYDSLVAQLAARTVHRQYVTLVWGVPSAARGVVDAPIGRSSSRRTRMAVRTEGRAARTEYVVEEVFDDPTCARLACRLETGRTHQIRVHLAAIGHPVVGDAPYGGARPQLSVGRPFLHAATLAFVHPATGVEVRFDAPLPRELAELLERLRHAGG